MDDYKLLEVLIRAFDQQLEIQKGEVPRIRYDRVQDELNGELSDIEFLDKPRNIALLYFLYGAIKPLEDSTSKEYTSQYLEQIINALRLAKKSLDQDLNGVTDGSSS